MPTSGKAAAAAATAADATNGATDMKRHLFHAIPPASHESQSGWEGFLRDTELEHLPAEVEKLARNVWLLPDDHKTYLVLSKIGHAHAIATRMLPFLSASGWQPLSTHP